MSPFDSNDRSPLLQCPPLVSTQRNLLLQCPAPFNSNQTSSLLQLMSSPGQTPEESSETKVEEPSPPPPRGQKHYVYHATLFAQSESEKK